ncbi:MAG: hypothetical protein LAT68_11995 [Cyclobacteriaceae bacterium]|nr:hypothetical protein [Cyclobacteriaceae bacterium]MCH8517038.1 hypothetical protein [Cyclobacteriaceae bacterium]
MNVDLDKVDHDNEIIGRKNLKRWRIIHASILISYILFWLFSYFYLSMEANLFNTILVGLFAVQTLLLLVPIRWLWIRDRFFRQYKRFLNIEDYQISYRPKTFGKTIHIDLREVEEYRYVAAIFKFRMKDGSWVIFEPPLYPSDLLEKIKVQINKIMMEVQAKQLA